MKRDRMWEVRGFTVSVGEGAQSWSLRSPAQTYVGWLKPPGPGKQVREGGGGASDWLTQVIK